MKIQIKFWSWAVIAAVSLFGPALPSRAAVDIYLNFPGIPGEVTATGFAQQIAVSSLSGGISNTVTILSSGVQVGRPTVTDIVITKNLDSASTPLYLACAQGTLARNVVITMAKAVGTGAETAFYTISMNTAVVKSVQASFSSGGVPMETVVLTPVANIQWSYAPTRSDGTLGTPIIHNWDIIDNTGS